MACIEGLNPASILDVGVGMGQYGFLARNNLENVNLFQIDGASAAQRPKSEWRVRIDGIEAFSTYFTPVHDYVYNNIMIGDALDLLPRIPDGSYELAMAVDILEHFDKPEGRRLLSELKRVAKRAVLVSTPKEFMHQEVEANPYENHRSCWTREELQQEGMTELLENDMSWVVVQRKSMA